jgi:hypothetical protein
MQSKLPVFRDFLVSDLRVRGRGSALDNINNFSSVMGKLFVFCDVEIETIIITHINLMSHLLVHSHRILSLPVAMYVNVVHPAVFYNNGVSTATGYGLDGTGIESRWSEIFRTRPDRPWGPPSLL